MPDLAPKSEFPCSGFGNARWVFWRKRCKHIYHCGNEQVAKLARGCFEEAVFKGMRIGIELPGEKIYLTRAFKALDAEFAARGMQGSVNPEDIEIDMDWAEED
ncbi:hypothetical protein BDV38DRAFT_279301 [Aspergillus pseudotamarii]|uniref:Uncharacterized protein n=1 Tax=Aspergillus pseudotamarii TaxID=132259 RepID=A0A5N6T535_ASPPS|nr:uncharacterized protein BDV38DRAFT_279301 [Aspergillus pseudotamarii]KAE8141400.1 hypothetical protein BDV38DRAFT_279301 [Aspergillus pseudotamarii]